MLRILHVRFTVSQPGGQFVHYVPEDDGVDVLPQHVEEEPVTHLGPAHYRVDSVSPDQPEPQPQQVHPHARAQDDYYPRADIGHYYLGS